MTTWRDFTERLTPEQIAEIEWYENDRAGLSGEGGINIAQNFLRINDAQQRYAHIPAPTEATTPPGPWAEWDDDVWNRSYTATTATVAGTEETFTVEVNGYQYSDGRDNEQHIWLEGGGQITAEQARTLAAALLAAADKLDQLNGDAPPFM